MSFPSNLIASLGGPQALAITAAAGLVVGATGAATVGGAFSGPPDRAATLPIYACPDTGPELTRVPAGQRMLVTGRTEDGTWLRIHFPAPDRQEAWVEAAPLQLAGTLDSIPVATCGTTAIAPLSASPVPAPSLSEVLVPDFTFPPEFGTSPSPGTSASAGPSSQPQDPNAPSVALVPSPPLTNKPTTIVKATFSTPVTDLEPADFSFTGGPANSCTVSEVKASSASVYLIKVGCKQDGTVALVLGPISVEDSAGTAGPSVPVSASMTFDREAPRATVAIKSNSPTKSAKLTSVVTFSEPVKSVDPAAFAIAGTAGCKGGAIAKQADTSFAITLSCTKSGNVTVTFRAGKAVDAAGNPGPARGAVSNTVVLDLDAPEVKSFTPALATTNLLSVSYKLTFTEAVSGLAPGDFSLAGSTAQGCSVAVPQASGTAFVPKVTCKGPGTVVLTLAAKAVSDGVGNEGPAKPTVAATATLDQTPPDATITTSPLFVRTTTPTFRVTFTEAVTGLAEGDFLVASRGTRCGIGSVAAVTGDPAKFDVTLSCADTAGGSVILRLSADSATDLAGNTGPPAQVSSPTLTIDSIGPTISNVSCGDCTTLFGGKGLVGASATVTDNSGVKGVRAIVTPPQGSAYSVTMVQREVPGPYTATLATGSDPVGTYRFTIEATDALGNVAVSAELKFTITQPIFLGPVGSLENVATTASATTSTSPGDGVIGSAALAMVPFGGPLLAFARRRRPRSGSRATGDGESGR